MFAAGLFGKPWANPSICTCHSSHPPVSWSALLVVRKGNTGSFQDQSSVVQHPRILLVFLSESDIWNFLIEDVRGGSSTACSRIRKRNGQAQSPVDRTSRGTLRKAWRHRPELRVGHSASASMEADDDFAALCCLKDKKPFRHQTDPETSHNHA